MRRRMLFSTLVVAVVAVLLLGLPLGALTHQSLFQERVTQLQREAELIATRVDTELRQDADSVEPPVDARRLGENHPTAYISITLPDGEVIAVGDPGLEGSEDALAAWVSSAEGAEIAVWDDSSDVQANAVSAWLGITSLSLLAIGVAVGLAMLQARRLTLPLVDLAATAQRLGSGVAGPQGHRYGIPEVDRVAEVLDRSAERVSGLIASERHFATDASHQLRTPLTALTMRLEELITHAEDPEAVRAEGRSALAQAERLTAIVEGLLSRARRSQHPDVSPVALDDVLIPMAAEWRPVLARDGRELRLTGEHGLTAMAVPADLAQILTTLVENARRHGLGTVTVLRHRSGNTVRIEVSDEGEGVPQDLVPHIFEREVSSSGGTGLGLALARHIAESEGARVELISSRPATFAVFLTAGEDPDPPTGPP